MTVHSLPNRLILFVGIWLFACGMLLSTPSQALPAFANQTGQNCMACHAGGQFPELTPYGRIFKLTGYTLGERAMSVSVMGVAGASKIKNVDSVNTATVNASSNGQGLSTPIKNNQLDAEIGSVFLAGRVTDNIGAFLQMTYDRFGGADSSGNNTVGTTGADNMDIRYADQIVTPSTNLIYGLSLNNNPSLSDPWNTSPAWMQYVPQTNGKGANTYTDANSIYPSNGLAGGSFASGVTGYAFLNKKYYAELGFYRTANNLFSFMNSNNNPNYLSGTNPYWRLAYNKEWGPENWMIGLSGMTMHYIDPDSSVSTSGVPINGAIGDAGNYLTARVIGLDTQYQYLLDPHTITLQGVYQHQDTHYAANNTTATTPTSMDILRLKASYVYMAKYGGSFAYFNASDASMQGNTSEIFYMPIQNVRIGLQYTNYTKLTAMTDYGALASDANTLHFFIWAAY